MAPSSLSTKLSTSKGCYRSDAKTLKKVGALPICYELEDVRHDQYPVEAGGFADIYKGSLQDQTICVKMIRLYQKGRIEDMLKKVMKEAILWEQLSHPNVVPFYGLYRFGKQIGLVLQWIENGDLTTWLKNKPNAPRINLAADVANGLAYLHKNKIVHGDLKGPNVLIDTTGRALLTDFGISSVSGVSIIAWSSQSPIASRGGTIRWQAPEIFDPASDKGVKNSLASDVYSLGCVCFQIFTGELPFEGIPNDSTIIALVQKGHRPQRPHSESPPWNELELTDQVWLYIERCWEENPSKRPFSTEMADNFTRISTRTPPRLSSNYVAHSAADFRRQLTRPLDMDALDAIRRTFSSVIHAQPEKSDTGTSATASPSASSSQRSPISLPEVQDTVPYNRRSLQGVHNSYLLPPYRAQQASQVHGDLAFPTTTTPSSSIILAPQEANPSLLSDAIPLLPYIVPRRSYSQYHGHELPHGWKHLTHPEGHSYFYHPEKRIVTGCCIWNASEFKVLKHFIHSIEEHNRTQCLELPGDAHLVLEVYISEGSEWWCGYYYAYTSARTLFWLEPYDISDDISRLGVKGEPSTPHLPDLYLEFQYWCHWHRFPDINSPTGDIYDLVANAIKDAGTSLPVNEPPKTMENLEEMANAVEDLRNRRPSRARWCLGCFMWLLKKERFLNCYGKRGTLRNHGGSSQESGRTCKQTFIEKFKSSLSKGWQFRAGTPRTVQHNPEHDDAKMFREALKMARY